MIDDGILTVRCPIGCRPTGLDGHLILAEGLSRGYADLEVLDGLSKSCSRRCEIVIDFRVFWFKGILLVGSSLPR